MGTKGKRQGPQCYKVSFFTFLFPSKSLHHPTVGPESNREPHSRPQQMMRSFFFPLDPYHYASGGVFFMEKNEKAHELE